MKKTMMLLFGLFLSGAALACNMDRQDCSGLMIPELQRYADELSNNKAWQTGADPKDVAKVKRYGERLNNCADYKCSNQVLFYYTNEMRGLASKYRQSTAPKQKAVAREDSWKGQCVYVPNANITKYYDPRGNDASGVVKGGVYMTTRSSDSGDYIDVVTIPDEGSSWVGWVKKVDLEIQDLRNCN